MKFNDTEDSNVFYYASKPITYTDFSIHMMMIALHIGIVALNSCVIKAIAGSRRLLSKPGGHCILTVSMVYLWHGVVMVFTFIYGLAEIQDPDLCICLLRYGIVHSAFMMIGWANCLLTLDRYLQIEWPFWYRKKMNNKTIWILNFIAALLAHFYCFSPLIFAWDQQNIQRLHMCEYFSVMPQLYTQIFFGIVFCVFPLLVAAYTRMLYIFRKSRISSNRQTKGNWKAAKIAFIMCSLYIVSWIPPAVFYTVVSNNVSYPNIPLRYTPILNGLISITSLAGIIIVCLAALQPQIKHEFIRLISCNNYQRETGSKKSGEMKNKGHTKKMSITLTTIDDGDRSMSKPVGLSYLSC